MPDFPSHIHTRCTPGAGTGLFTNSTIAAGEEILRIDRPLVAVLDSPHLHDTCANCHLLLRDDAGPDGMTLKHCMGCKVVKYCSKVHRFFVLVLLCGLRLKEISLLPFVVSIFTLGFQDSGDLDYEAACLCSETIMTSIYSMLA